MPFIHMHVMLHSLFNIFLVLQHPSGNVDFDGISRKSVQKLTFQIDTGFLAKM